MGRREPHYVGRKRGIYRICTTFVQELARERGTRARGSAVRRKRRAGNPVAGRMYNEGTRGNVNEGEEKEKKKTREKEKGLRACAKRKDRRREFVLRKWSLDERERDGWGIKNSRARARADGVVGVTVEPRALQAR